MKILGLLFTSILFTSIAFADELSVKPDKPLIAAPVSIRLDINLKPGEKVRMPESVKLPADLEFLSYEASPPVIKEDGSKTVSVIYKVESYKVGEITIPEFEYVIVNSSGQEIRRKTGPVSFKVVSVRNDPATADDAKDIRAPSDASLRWSAYLYPALALIAAIIAGALLWKWFSGRRKAPTAPPPLPLIPPHELAYERLAKLKADDPFGKGLMQEHFFRISEIVRGYLEGRYGLLALERTTLELKAGFDHRYATQETRSKLINLLASLDLVKFAKRIPERKEADDALRQALDFVDATRHVEEEEVA